MNAQQQNSWLVSAGMQQIDAQIKADSHKMRGLNKSEAIIFLKRTIKEKFLSGATNSDDLYSDLLKKGFLLIEEKTLTKPEFLKHFDNVVAAIERGKLRRGSKKGEKELEILALFDSGVTERELYEKFVRSHVYFTLVNHGRIKKRDRWGIERSKSLKSSKIMELLNSGKSICEVVVDLKTTKFYVKQVMKENGFVIEKTAV